MKFLAFVVSVSLALVLGSSIATAQYPQPTGNITLTSAATTAATGADVPLECVLRDAAGVPIAGVECVFTIESEPEGSNAAVGSKSVSRTTDANGVARTTLKTGDVPGQIIVSASSGTFRSVVVVTVTSGGQPPAAPILPPATGDGGLVK